MRLPLLPAGFVLAWLLLSGQSQAAAESRPNIVVILADDLGWGSLGCYGGQGLETPNVDRLAREGRRFTEAYAPSSVCSPSRYGLLTGRYYWRTAVKDGGVLPVDAPLHIETDRLTLASLCKERGYQTAAVGKWHLGFQAGQAATDWSQPLEPGPRAIGFDYFFGLAANTNNGPHTFIENETLIGRIPGERVTITGKGQTATTTGIQTPFEPDHVMERLTAEATRWIEAHAADPFFLYFAPNAVHGPIVPNPRFQGSRFGSYGNFIHELDWSVGQLLDTLDRLQLADNTLVIFTSDNGGIADPTSRNVAEAIKAGLTVNGSLRGGKHGEYEGGFREPFVVRWPGHVPAGTTSSQLISLCDLPATVADLLDIPLPAGAAEDSLSILRAFVEPEPGPPLRDHVILQSAHGVYAIRQGDWKFIERADPPVFEPRPGRREEGMATPAPDHDELFNLRADLSETNDHVEGSRPEAAALAGLLAHARTAGHTRPLASRRPNVLIFLADDLGYGELGCQGFATDVPTPQIDSLAANGVRFTNGYVSCPYCSPSRAGLLTGRYQQRFGYEFNPGPGRLTPPTVGLPVEETTLGDRFQAAGYTTGWFGKSHLGYAPPFHPLRRGFHSFFGFLGGKHDYFDALEDPFDPILRDETRLTEIDYLTDAFGHEAAAFIDRNADQPWMCFVPFNAVHAPLQAPDRYLDRFPDMADPKRRTFAAMLAAMDDAVGVVMAAVRRHGLEDDTLVVFLSDNGGPTESITSSNGPLRGFKSQTWEGGIRVPFIMQWTGHIPASTVEDRPVIQLDILPTALAAAGVKLDPAWHLDGVDLLPYLTGHDSGMPHETLYWRFGPQMAMRQGDWKLVKAPGHGVDPSRPRDGRADPAGAALYHLASDPGEAVDLAERYPAKAAELAAIWQSIDHQMLEPKWRDGPAERGTAPKNAAGSR